MLKLVCHIAIQGSKNWEFTSVSSCIILEDIATLTDTCELTLAKNITWENYLNDFKRPPINRGDKITVKLGYDNQLETRFTGYIRTVDAKTPITIKCEDGMFLLKREKVIPKTFKNATLKEIIEHLLHNTSIEFKLIDDNIKVGNWRLTKANVSEELQELKEKMMLMSYFRTINGKSYLYVGLAYPLDNRRKLIFKHAKNIISEDFEYRNREEIRARVEAQSFDAKHRKIAYEFGDKDGEVIKLRIDGLTQEELKRYAQQALERYKKSGFKGSFVTFGAPEVRKCDMVAIHASDGNKGTYLVRKNEIEFGTRGYRQKIELGQPLTIN